MTGPTVPTKAEKFYQPGVTTVIKLPAVAGTFPTLAEITAGTVVSNDLTATSGWDTSVADLPTKDFGGTWVGSLPGDETPNSSSLSFWADPTGADMSGVYTKGEVCHHLFVWQGLGESATSLCTFYKNTRIGSVNRAPDNSAVAQLTVAVSLGEAPVDGQYPTS